AWGCYRGCGRRPRLWARGRRRPADAAAGRFHVTEVSVEIPGDLTEQFDGLVFPPRSLIAGRSVVTRGRQLDDHSVMLGADTHKLIEDADGTEVLLITLRNPPLVAVAHAGIAIVTRSRHQVRRVRGDCGLYPVSGDDLLAVELAVQAEPLTDTRIITGGSIETSESHRIAVVVGVPVGVMVRAQWLPEFCLCIVSHRLPGGRFQYQAEHLSVGRAVTVEGARFQFVLDLRNKLHQRRASCHGASQTGDLAIRITILLKPA